MAKSKKLTVEDQSILNSISKAKAKEHQDLIDEIESEITRTTFAWDFPKSAVIDHFDTTKSYEVTGYKPIDGEHSLDFRPEWFTEVRDDYIKTGKYTQAIIGSKAYRDFWTREWARCREGLTVNGYTVTGSHYFFLNYYQLPNVMTVKAGTSREESFPRFLVYQYEYFHYYELCKVVKKNVVLMKSRGIGFSEITASIAACMFSVYPKSNTVITAQNDIYLSTTLDKVWSALTFLNDNTQEGFLRLRQVIDTARHKRASYYVNVNGQKIEQGIKSEVRGIVADDDSKIRGARTDLLIFEEAGHNINLRKSYIKGEALVNINGWKFGIICAGGTGGDKGPQMAGLIDMYYNPNIYDALPFKHRYTQDGEEIYSGFFIPAFKALFLEGYIDHRGWCNDELARQYYQAERDRKSTSPKALMDYSAEFCFNAEEAFALEGSNKFNKVLLAEQMVQMRVHKQGPSIATGEFRFITKSGSTDANDNIAGVKWIPSNNGLVNILEHPLWETTGLKDGDKKYQEMRNLYVAGIDSIDMGNSQTSDLTRDPSKFCIVIKRRAFGMREPMYVAYYMFRPDDERIAYRTAIQLLMYYNCQANIEATRISMLTWAKNKGFYHFFMPRPRATYPDINKINGRRPVGTPGTAHIIEHQTDLIANFIEDYAHTLWFPEMVDQLIRYTDENKTKFDLIAAMGMCELADEELSGVAPRVVEDENSEWQDMGWYTDSKGYKHFGILPNTSATKATLQVTNQYQSRTSDPRYRW